jgi:N-acetylglucosaminyl-diphospho-decaprenol L-rhamnosyltransferase
MKTTIEIIIVNWNSGDQLNNCVRSIEATDQSLSTIERVTIIDNNSTDGSADSIEESTLPVSLIHNRENKGFGYACNQGARGSKAKYLLFLNPDVILYRDSIAAVMSFLNQQDAENVGVCGIQLIGSDGNIQRTCHRPLSFMQTFYDICGISRVFPKLFHGNRMAEWDHTDNRFVGHVIGAFYVIRRQLFEKLHGFDERYFVYMEDYDLSMRILKAGQRIHFLSCVRAFHKGGGTTDAIKATRLWYSLNSRTRLYKQYFPKYIWLFLCALLLMIELPLRIVLALCHLSRGEVIDTLRAFWWLLVRNLPISQSR